MKQGKIIIGKVRRGKQRGKLLSYPTANINIHKKIPQAVYLSYVKLEKQLYPALTFVGSAKTFNEKDAKVETYIFFFNKNIYNKWISIRLLKKIRNNKKFPSAKELIVRLKKDEQIAKKYFKI